MKKSTLGIIALSASMFAVGFLLAAESSPAITVPSAAPAPKPQKLIKVCTLPTAQANQEFQNNVQIMQAQRQQVVEANAAYEKETNATKKKELKAKLDELMAKLSKDNQTMFKAYGFSIDRNYTMQIESSTVWMFVTDEEAANFEKQQAAAAAKEKAAPAKK